MKKFLGLQYPLKAGPRGLLAQSSGVDQIKADLLQLLLTRPGERVMIPGYGVALHTLIFEPNDATLALRAKQMIASAILTWEPRIEITGIEVGGASREDLDPEDTGDEIGSILFVRIRFVDPQNISQVEELALTLPTGA